MRNNKSFRQELQELINIHSIENKSDTPDFILAEYIVRSLRAYDIAINKRDAWYNKPKPEQVWVRIKTDKPPRIF